MHDDVHVAVSVVAMTRFAGAYKQVPPTIPTGQENPALQVQLVKAALPAGELEFAGQTVQAADPVDALYFPASHAVQVLDVDPLLQEATNPELTTETSDTNTTCMYPVLDV